MEGIVSTPREKPPILRRMNKKQREEKLQRLKSKLERKKVNYKQYLKVIVLPSIKSYFNKIVYSLFYGLLTLLILRLFDYSMTTMNFLSAIALYFFLEDVRHLLILITRNKK